VRGEQAPWAAARRREGAVGLSEAVVLDPTGRSLVGRLRTRRPAAMIDDDSSHGRARPQSKEEDVKDFKAFLLRGNLVEIAVGIVIGVAFTAVVTAFVGDLVTPLLAAVGGQPNFGTLTFTINKSHFFYGAFIDSLFAFFLIALVIFFLVVKPVNGLIARSRTSGTPDPTTRNCPECLSEVPVAARRCAFCTAEIEPVAS
jgi:large conductance mechanosensitive channel